MSKKQSFLKGASILGGAGIVIKILGAAFKIPLGNLIGGDGMALFMAPYPFYNWLLVIAAAGIPAAIAKLVAEREMLEDYEGAYKVIRVVRKPLMLLSVIFFVCVFFGAPYIAKSVSLPQAELAFRTIAPALLFVPMMAIYRGFFQGQQRLEVFAVSQIIEQVFRVALGLGLAFLLYKKGTAYAAAGATFGAAGGGLVALVFVYVAFKHTRHKDMAHKVQHQSFTYNNRDILKEVLVVAIPITIGASIVPTMNTVDLFMVVNRLKVIEGLDQAKNLYGILTGFAVTIVNFPQILTASLQISLVPAIAKLHMTYKASGQESDRKHLANSVGAGIKISLIIGLPCAVGLAVMADPIMLLLYSSRVDEALLGGNILKFLAWDLIFLALYQATTGILIGLDRQMVPAKHLGVGLIFKLVLTYVLVGIPSLGIVGAALSTVGAFAVASMMNLWVLTQDDALEIHVLSMVGKPCLSVGFMGLVVAMLYGPLEGITGHKLATVTTISIGALVYVVMILKTKTLSADEFDLIPGGGKLKKIAEKLG